MGRYANLGNGIGGEVKKIPSEAHLLSRGSGQDESGEHREGILGVGRPALDGRSHGEAEERHRLRQREGLIVLLRVSAEQT